MFVERVNIPEKYLLVENTVKDKDEKSLQRVEGCKDVVKCNLVRGHG